MIYLLPEKDYPNPSQYLEEFEYKDENDFTWKVARVSNGFFVRYFGDPYFKYSIFTVQPKGKKIFKIKNTNCIFFNDPEFDSFYNVRNILKNGYTDDIWDCIEEFLEERFTHDEGILKSEIV